MLTLHSAALTVGQRSLDAKDALPYLATVRDPPQIPVPLISVLLQLTSMLHLL